MHDGILTELRWQRASRGHNSTSQLAATSSQLTAYQGRQARGVAGIRFCFSFLASIAGRLVSGYFPSRSRPITQGPASNISRRRFLSYRWGAGSSIHRAIHQESFIEHGRPVTKKLFAMSS